MGSPSLVQCSRTLSASSIGKSPLHQSFKTPFKILGGGNRRKSAHAGTASGHGDGWEASISAPGEVGLDEVAPEITARKEGQIGSWRSIPNVPPPDEFLRGAIRRSMRVGISIRIKNEAAKARNLAARRMDTLMKEVSGPLKSYVKGFPEPHHLHPFDAALLDLTVSRDRYSAVLRKVDALRKSTLEVGRSYASQAASASNKKHAEQIAVDGYETMTRVYNKGSKCIKELVLLARDLRKLPVIDAEIPTLALVGAPNVGKSSMVQAISSGKPEICNYPFTTRTIKMGHFFVDNRKHQITDTPGLLNREDGERNAMEKLTLATLGHLPTSVVFIIDLTEECGTSIQDQLKLRKELRNRFPGKCWIDVFSKEDLLLDLFKDIDGHDQQNKYILEGKHAISEAHDAVLSIPKALRVSCMTSNGLISFKKRVIAALENSETVESMDAKV